MVRLHYTYLLSGFEWRNKKLNFVIAAGSYDIHSGHVFIIIVSELFALL